MQHEIWINLPVKDVKRSADFYQALGFTLNPRYTQSEHAACLIIGEKMVVVMLFAEPLFAEYVQQGTHSPADSSQVLLSLSVSSRDEVKNMAVNAISAGGVVFAAPAEKDGWMYGMGFADPDGHRWTVLHMNPAALDTKS